MDSVSAYMQQKNELLQMKADLLDKQISLEEVLRSNEQQLNELDTVVSKMCSSLEDELKN